jgi:hypothetical protein
MAVLNRDQSAAGGCTEARRALVTFMVGLLIAAATGSFAISARANGSPSGSMGMGSSGRMVTAPMSGPRRIGSIHSWRPASLHRSRFGRQSLDAFERARDFRRFHDHEHDDFGGGFFPFGFWPDFGWPVAQSDVAAADDTGGMGWGTPYFWPRPVERYEPPTVEKTPSGVTIIRGPGSPHRVWP